MVCGIRKRLSQAATIIRKWSETSCRLSVHSPPLLRKKRWARPPYAGSTTTAIYGAHHLDRENRMMDARSQRAQEHMHEHDCSGMDPAPSWQLWQAMRTGKRVSHSSHSVQGRCIVSGMRRCMTSTSSAPPTEPKLEPVRHKVRGASECLAKRRRKTLSFACEFAYQALLYSGIGTGRGIASRIRSKLWRLSEAFSRARVGMWSVSALIPSL